MRSRALFCAAFLVAGLAGAQNPNHWRNFYTQVTGPLDGTETFILQLITGTCLSGPLPVPATCQRWATAQDIADLVTGISDTFLTVEVDGTPVSTLAPTFNFLGSQFLLVESPADDFAISLLAPGSSDELIVNNAGTFGSGGPNVTWDGVDFTYTKNAVAAALVESFVLQNTTAAAAGAQQWSPALILRGQGWKTEATAASQSVEFALQAEAVEGFSNPDGLLSISASINGAAYDPLAFFDSGVLNSVGGLIFPNNKLLSWFDAGGTARPVITVNAFDDVVFNSGETLPGSFIFELTAGEELFAQTSGNDRVFQVRHSDGRGAFGAATFPNADTMLELYTDGADNALTIHEDGGANDAYVRIQRGGVFWDLGQLGTTNFKFKSNAGVDLLEIQTDGDLNIGGNVTLGGVNAPATSEFSIYTELFGDGLFVSSPDDLILQAAEDASGSGEVVFRTNALDRARFTNAGNFIVTPGTIDGAVTADHVDAMGEIAAGIKRGPDATDTHLLTTDVAAPGGLTCLEMDTDGSVVLAGAACAAGSALTVEEADGTPTVANVDTIQFNQADGLQVVDETGGQVQVNLTLAGETSGSGGATIVTDVQPNAVDLGSETVGNFVLTLGSSNSIVVTGADAEGSTKTPAFDYTATLAGDPGLPNGEVVMSSAGNGVLFEGVADAFEGLLQWLPTATDRTLTLPDTTDQLVGRATVDTLTNKSIVATQLTGTVDAARVGADHVDLMSEIAAGIKRGPDATDTHLLTTDVAAPGSPECMQLDTDGSVILSGSACAAGGAITLDSIADPEAVTTLVMGAIAETVTWDFQAAFTTGCQLCIVSSVANPSGGFLMEVNTHDAQVGAFQVSSDLGPEFTVEPGGDIGINNMTAPSSPLHVRSDGSSALRIEEVSGGESWNFWVDSTGKLIMQSAAGFGLTISNATNHVIIQEDLRVDDELAVNLAADAAEPLHIKADGGLDLVRFEEGSGTEFYNLSINSSGDLFFESDAGNAVLTLSDADEDVTIHDILRIVPKITAPAACAIGDVYTDTSGAICHCSATNTWEALGATGTCV